MGAGLGVASSPAVSPSVRTWNTDVPTAKRTSGPTEGSERGPRGVGGEESGVLAGGRLESGGGGIGARPPATARRYLGLCPDLNHHKSAAEPSDEKC